MFLELWKEKIFQKGLCILAFSSSSTVFISLTHSGEAFAFIVPMKLLISVTMTLSLLANLQILFYLTYWQHLIQLIVPSFIKHYLYNSSMSLFFGCPSLLCPSCYFSISFNISPTSKCWGHPRTLSLPLF